MLKKRITWLALGLIAALGVTVAAAPPQNLIPVYLWLSGQAVSASNPVPTVGAYKSGACDDDGDVDALEEVCNVATSGYRQCAFTFSTSVTLTNFNIDGSTDGSNYVNLYDTTAEFANPAGLLIGVRPAGSDLNVAANGTTYRFVMDVGAHTNIRLRAASTNANFTGNYSCGQ